MSMPEFKSASLTREEVVNQIISSIAMEELGLSHIINAEGEKLQYILGTLDGKTGPTPSATIEDVLKVNESVRMVLQSAAESQSLLRNKLQNVLASAVLTGPTGPSGPTGLTGPGSTLPFSSGSEKEMELATTAAGDPARPGILGIRAFNNGLTFTADDDIDLTAAPKIAADFSILVPRNGAVTDISARFYTTQPLTLTGTTGTAAAQLYQSVSPTSDVFELIGSVTLQPELVPAQSPYPAGTVLSVTKNGEAFPVDAGTRLLLAFTVQASGTNPGITLTGYANASIEID